MFAAQSYSYSSITKRTFHKLSSAAVGNSFPRRESKSNNKVVF